MNENQDNHQETNGERARRLERERSRGLVEADKQSMGILKKIFPISHIQIFPSREEAFHAYVFFETTDQLVKSESDGSRGKIEDEIYRQLENVGRGSRPEVSITFEYDSEEIIKRDFRGSYYLRMR